MQHYFTVPDNTALCYVMHYKHYVQLLLHLSVERTTKKLLTNLNQIFRVKRVWVKETLIRFRYFKVMPSGRAPGQAGTGRILGFWPFAAGCHRFMDFSPHGHFAPWAFHPMDVSPHRRFAPETIRPTDAVNINKL